MKEQQDITAQLSSTWKSVAGWSVFLSIAGLLHVLLLLAGVLWTKEIIGAMRFAYGANTMLDSMEDNKSLLPFFFLMAATGLILVYVAQLFFAIRIKQSLRNADQLTFERAWRNLRNSFRFFGMFLIVLTAVYLIFLGMLLFFLKS